MTKRQATEVANRLELDIFALVDALRAAGMTTEQAAEVNPRIADLAARVAELRRASN